MLFLIYIVSSFRYYYLFVKWCWKCFCVGTVNLERYLKSFKKHFANFDKDFQTSRHHKGDAAEFDSSQIVLLGNRFRVSDASSVQQIASKSLQVK